MALGTYSQLKTAIETWMARSGDTEISGNSADLVTLAEDRLNRDLPLRVNYTDGVLTGTAGLRTLTLPSDFYEPVALWLTTFGTRDMLTPYIPGNVEADTTSGTPQAWGVNGTNIDLDVLCDQAHTFLFRYRKSFALSDSATTNWLLTNHPALYLQACLFEAEMLAKDFEAAAVRNQIVESMIEKIAWKDARSLALAPLMIDPALAGYDGFNINTG